MGNKKLKKDNFVNTTLWLEQVIGGDINNPVCGGGSQKSIQALIGLYNGIIRCNDTIAAACDINNAELEYDEALFSTCNETNAALRDEIDECVEKPESVGEGEICQCFSGLEDNIDRFKKKLYPIETKNGTVDRNCISILGAGSEKIKPKYNECVNALKDCNNYETSAISIINACHNDDGSRFLVGHAKAAMDEDEDYLDRLLDYDNDYEDY